MAFNSMAFLFGLLPAVLVCYFLLPARWRTGRNWVLLVFSLAAAAVGIALLGDIPTLARIARLYAGSPPALGGLLLSLAAAVWFVHGRKPKEI